jgi:hypothetical protein
MKILTQNIGVVVATVMIAVAVLVYNSFFKPLEVAPAIDPPTELIGTEALHTLSLLQSVTLDTSLLSSEKYLSLTDFSVEVPVLPTGRVNPFAAIGR